MPSAETAAKAALYRSLTPEVADADGFVDTDTCDSIHWSTLRAIGGPEINVRAAVEDRRLHRRPLHYAECYPKDSASTVSSDAALYTLAYAMDHKDRELIQDIFSNAKEHGWKMGDGPDADTTMRPGLRALYAIAIKRLGGPSFGEALFDAFSFAQEFGHPTGYEAQLQVVGILVALKLDGGASDWAVKALRAQSDRQPDNALFAAAAGKFDKDQQAHADELLRNAKWWPADRLPTSDDVCENWLTQRDESDKDWGPCPAEHRKHSGGDFLFAYAVLTGEF